MQTDLTRRTVHNGGVDLAVWEGGYADGPTLLLVHGWPDTHTLWHGVIDELAEEFHVVAYDTRGQGESSDPGSDEAFALPELVADFFAVADAVSPDEPVHVLAHDWGSVQVWDAVCEPGASDRIASFTSISGPNIDHLSSWVRRNLRHPSVRGLRDVLAQAASSYYIAIFVSPVAPAVFRRFATPRRWEQLLRRTEGFRPSPEDHAPSLTDDMVSGLRYYRANVGGGLGRRPRERRTTVPVLQLVPIRDVAIRKASLEESDRFTDRIERRELPYGHWVVLSNPDVVAAETARFIESVTP